MSDAGNILIVSVYLHIHNCIDLTYMTINVDAFEYFVFRRHPKHLGGAGWRFGVLLKGVGGR